MPNLESSLIEILEEATPDLNKISESQASKKPLNKWSKKEIMGHLIDSACNNHIRFVKAQGNDELLFEGYDQEQWVIQQNYNARSWLDIVKFWKLYNVHLSMLIDNISEHDLDRKRTKHHLNKIAWQTVPDSQSTTLRYFIEDYLAHLRHHLNQII